VDKPEGYYESLPAALLIGYLHRHLDAHDLGIVLGADATLRLAPGQVRLPDGSFVSWDRFPGRRLPREPIADLAPDLAVGVLSAGNTDAEMARKLHDYFAAGCRLVWYVDPDDRTVRVYTDTRTARTLRVDDVLDGGDVLPGFRLPSASGSSAPVPGATPDAVQRSRRRSTEPDSAASVERSPAGSLFSGIVGAALRPRAPRRARSTSSCVTHLVTRRYGRGRLTCSSSPRGRPSRSRK
jgi:Uma2 family endonuclease